MVQVKEGAAVGSHAEIRHRHLTPGQLAARAGVNVSALHFYEREGLIASARTVGNQRRYHRDVLRRIAFIRTSQKIGVSLADIAEALASLPDNRTPTKADWARLSRRWRSDLDERLAYLERLRDSLDGCIGCGCLSLTSCSLYNLDDELAQHGTGPVRWTRRVVEASGTHPADQDMPRSGAPGDLRTEPCSVRAGRTTAPPAGR